MANYYYEYCGKSFSSIQQLANGGVLDYVDKGKISEWISKQRYNSAEVRKTFRDATKVVESFENPTIVEENSTRFRTTQESTQQPLSDKIQSTLSTLSEKFNTPVNTTTIAEITNDEIRQAAEGGAKAYYDVNTGEVTYSKARAFNTI